MRYGLNYHPQFGKIDIEWVRKAQPPVMLVMDDNERYDECNRIHAASPNTIVIHRRFGAWENSTLVSAAEYIGRFKGAPDWLYHNVMNEPNILPSLSYLVALMHEGKRQNIRLAVGNFSTGSWQLTDIDAGKYDDWLYVSSQYRDFHLAAVHEYGVADLRLFFNNGNEPKHLIDPTRLNDANYITKERFLSDWRTNYHLGRYLYLVERCKRLNITPPRFVLTEFGWDRNGDILGLVPELDGYAEKRVTGQNSLDVYFRKVYSGLAFEDVVFNQLEHMSKVYTEHVIGACLYAWSHNSEWEAYNYAGRSTLLDKLATLQQPSTPPAPPVVTVPVVVSFPTSGFTQRLIQSRGQTANFRQQPTDKDDRIIDTITRQPVLAELARTGAHNGWIPVRYNGRDGWIFDTVFDDWDVVTVPAEPVNKGLLYTLEATLKDMQAALASALETLDELKPKTIVDDIPKSA